MVVFLVMLVISVNLITMIRFRMESKNPVEKVCEDFLLHYSTSFISIITLGGSSIGRMKNHLEVK